MNGAMPLRRYLPTPRSTPELRTFVFRVTMLCVAIAVTVDVVNQLLFFEGWSAALRSWVISAGLALVLAAPISRTIGKAHLELFHAKQVVEKLSRTDPLTGLANRRALIEAADAAASGAVLILVIVDIDRFKRVNDSHGHIVGDHVIQAVSSKMIEHLGPLGLVCRLGGEEFALLANGRPIEDVLDGVWALRDHLSAAPIIVGDEAVAVTISAGVAIRAPGGSFNQLYAEADRALYVAKSGGRNRVDTAESVPSRENDRRQWRRLAGDEDAVA
jgi:diguanylate cyclase (GGDEF)-like protein